MARPHSVKNTWTVLEASTAIVLVLIRMLIVFVDESQSASLGAQVNVTQQALAGPHLQHESQFQDDEGNCIQNFHFSLRKHVYGLFTLLC